MAVTLLFAIPALLVAGGAADCARAMKRAVILQHASDATAKALGRVYINALSTSRDLLPTAQTNLSGFLKDAQVSELSLLDNDRSVCLATVLQVPTTVMALFKIDSVAVRAKACAQRVTG